MGSPVDGAQWTEHWPAKNIGTIRFAFGLEPFGQQGKCWVVWKRRAPSMGALRPPKVGIL